ncbi:MAG: hypothetical protein FWE74_07625 [Oscillospiraceae bacterium]|nr:hypothetical protein [Oscillospiraceae bacterium]
MICQNNNELKISKKRIIIISIVLLILTGLTIAIYFNIYNDINFSTIYNYNLDISISIGMKKEIVDKRLGTPVRTTNDFFEYDGGNITISYEDGMIESISIKGGRWRIQCRPPIWIGLKGDEDWDARKTYLGNENINYDEEKDKFSFYATRRRIVQRGNHRYYITFYFEEDAISWITISS